MGYCITFIHSPYSG